jgi:ABC-type oligopeptide transport system substrate-binding subunit
LRQQLVKAVDVRAIVRRKLGRLGIPAEGFLPPGLLGHESMPSWKSSSPTMKAHLGIRLTACISPRHQGRYSGVAEEIFLAWEKLGVQVDVVHPSESEYSQILNSPNVDLTVTGWTADYPDPDTFMHGAIHSQQGADGRFCGIKEIDELSAKARSESDPDSRHALYREMEKLIANRAILLPLFHEQTYRFARSDVQNLKLNFFFPAVAYDALWIKK